MNRSILVAALLLTACPSPTELPPELPTPITDAPPVTPVVETCDVDPTTLPFGAAWAPITFAPTPPSAGEQTWSGQISVPTALNLTFDDVYVFDAPATITAIADDGTTVTAMYSATGTCVEPCTWTQVDVRTATTSALLQSPGPDVSLESTALMALDISRAEAAARNGASGLVPGMQPDLDAAVPSLVSAMQTSFATDGTLAVGPGGPPTPGTTVFDAVEAALADPTIDPPTLPATASAWTLHSHSAPAGARLVVMDGNRVSLPVEPDASGTMTWHATEAATTPITYVVRYLFDDGRQSNATVLNRETQTSATGSLTVSGGEGDTIAVSGATSNNWVLQRSNNTGIQGACRADDAGSAILSAERTTGFTVLEVQDDLTLVDLASCLWEQGEADCI